MKLMVDNCPVPAVTGTVKSVNDNLLTAVLPKAYIGMEVVVDDRLPATVASLKDNNATLMPLGVTAGISVGSSVKVTGNRAFFPFGDGLLGRVIDPLGRPLDEKGALTCTLPAPLAPDRSRPLHGSSVKEQFETGIRAIDGLFSIGEGQRIGLFSGPGAGKSTLLGILAQNASCDVTVVCLVGERGREVSDFLTNISGEKGLEKSVVIVAGADSPAALKVRAPLAATAVASWFRSKGGRVLLLVDSLTRVVRAKRDMDGTLTGGAEAGTYPASAFAMLPEMLEQVYKDASGSITGVYTVLTDGKKDDDPVSEEIKSLLDGHIVLSSRLAARGHWPAIDTVQSISRVMTSVVSSRHMHYAEAFKRVVASYLEHEDMVLIGAYKLGMFNDTDNYLNNQNRINAFLTQSVNEKSSLSDTLKALKALAENF
jgi:FliI/YscN family ATPase